MTKKSTPEQDSPDPAPVQPRIGFGERVADGSGASPKRKAGSALHSPGHVGGGLQASQAAAPSKAKAVKPVRVQPKTK
jgi:hypothetical protein